MVVISSFPTSGQAAEVAPLNTSGVNLGRHGFLGPNAALSPSNALRFASVEVIENALFGGHLDAGGSHQPVSSALQCVTALSVSFFGVYLAVVCMRLTRTASRWLAGSTLPVTLWERKLIEATNGLGMAPMLSVLLVSARLRALQLDPSRGTEPAMWVQVCMYAGTAAFFLRIGLDLSLSSFGFEISESRLGIGGGGWAIAEYVMQGGVYLCSGTIYATSICILCFGALASPPSSGTADGKSSQVEVSPMIVCMSTLIVIFLAENALLEVLTALRHYLQRRTSTAPVVPPSTLLLGRDNQSQDMSFLELVPLHFPIMLCVLLVGIELRALQLNLQPPLWSVAAMYVSTACLVAQAAWASAMAILRTWPPAGGGKEGRDLQGEDGIAPPGFYRPLGVVLASAWVLVLCGLYASTAVVLASVFAMEEKPLGLLMPPEGAVLALHVERAQEDAAGRIVGAAVPPVSVAMRCVTLLTVMYFAFYLCFVVCGATSGQLRKWVQTVFGNVQYSLAFVPMLCVMMIAVRLRAMQLRVRDPQPWAQVVMLTATSAVIVQAVCNLFIQEDLAELSFASKVAYIMVLIVRNFAAAVVFGAVAALIAALLLMQPTADA